MLTAEKSKKEEDYEKPSPDIPFYKNHFVIVQLSHKAEEASLGIRQSPLGERLTDPTLGPSGRQERLNC